MRRAGFASTGFALATLIATWVAAAPAEAAGHQPRGLESGWASYYADFWQGRRTASGERFDNEALTAAHPWLPFGTRIRVMAERTGREVVVTITDRMGAAGRIIDLSQHAARELGIIQAGVAAVVLMPTE